MNNITAVKSIPSQAKYFAIMADGAEVEITRQDYFRIRAGLEPLGDFLSKWQERANSNGADMIDELTYACYRYNRDNSPDIAPERWSLIFGNVATLEMRYREDIVALLGIQS